MSELILKPSLAAALAKANAEIHNPAFDKVNPHFKSKFASLAAVRNAIVPPYARNGLSIIQDLQSTDGGVACYTTILHASGESMTLGPLVMPVTKHDAQGVTGAGTYAKRVHLQAVACVVGDEDDDGETAVGRPTGTTDIGKKTPEAPEGYAKWKADMAAVAGEGTERLQAVWKDSSKAFREFAAAHDLPWWNECKATAGKQQRAA
jgi:hypothetical protein